MLSRRRLAAALAVAPPCARRYAAQEEESAAAAAAGAGAVEVAAAAAAAFGCQGDALRRSSALCSGTLWVNTCVCRACGVVVCSMSCTLSAAARSQHVLKVTVSIFLIACSRYTRYVPSSGH